MLPLPPSETSPNTHRSSISRNSFNFSPRTLIFIDTRLTVPNNRNSGQHRENGARRPAVRHPAMRVMLLGIGAVAVIGGIAVAFDHYQIFPIHRIGGEKRLVFRLDAPYGSVDLRAGAGPNDIATLELLSENADAHSPQWAYGLQNGNVGMLRIGIGTDEGMVGQPPIAMWQTNSGFSPAAAITPQPDWGAACPPSLFSFTLPTVPYGYTTDRRMKAVSTDAGTTFTPEAKAGTRITLAKDLPIDFVADLGFGESSLDLSGLPITDARIESGASKVHVFCNQPNPAQLRNCFVHAGIGECTFTGISNLSANQFTFNGGFGSYHLGFDGKLTRNLQANIDLGIGMCTVSIPPTSCRVQVFYDDGLLSSFSFSGLQERRSGYWTSPGFDLSFSPVLTLHLSSGAGKISVSYH